ncbi:Frigida-like protein [Corchorus capsularis]|uniref:FRIGIDA-like protein n=1 Tax=Corchorus capsularis TaxID=210143 RepID=A0A1R3GBF2_COCAP|nr:Frigida-like protein [Corchorus capsularis]
MEIPCLIQKNFQTTIDSINREASSIISMTRQWQEFGGHYDSFVKSMDERYNQLSCIEDGIKDQIEELKKREEKLRVQEEAITKRSEELDRKEEELNSNFKSAKSQYEQWLKKLDAEEIRFSENHAKLQTMAREIQERDDKFLEFYFGKPHVPVFDEDNETPSTRSKSKTLIQSGLIEDLIDKDRRLQAIKHVFEFNLGDKFSPADLIQDHLRYIRRSAKFYKEKDAGLSNQIVTITKEIADLKAVIKCIQIHKLEDEIPLDKIENSIRKREETKIGLVKLGPCTRSKAKLDQLEQERIKKRLRSI